MKKEIPLILIIFIQLCLGIQCTKDTMNEEHTCQEAPCMNGGKCIMGICECPEGFAGSQCQDELLPVKVMISKVTINEFPSSDVQNQSWDPMNGPDLYIMILNGPDTIYRQQTWIENAKLDEIHEISLSPAAFTSQVGNAHTILLMDKDENSTDQKVASARFKPYTKNIGFPRSLIGRIELSHGIFDLEMDIDYSF